MSQSKEQIKFIRNTYWNATVGAAFQRSGIYKKEVTSKQRQEFRDDLRIYIEKIEKIYHEIKVSAADHVINIKKVQDWTKRHSQILNNEKLNFGISQKLLNVHLKGLWCFGILSNEPPHIPIDRLIQHQLGFKEIEPWTRIDSQEEYMRIIEKVNQVAKRRDLSLAKLELQEYNKLS